MQVVWVRMETMFRLLCTRGRWKQTCINKICWGVPAEHCLLQSFPSRRQRGNAQDSKVSLASSHFINRWGPHLYSICTEIFFSIPFLSVFAVWLSTPDLKWLQVPQTRRGCLKSGRLSTDYTKMKALLTESILFLLSSPQWGFPSGRRFRREVHTSLLWGTGDELSPMNLCKAAVVASSGFYWGRPLMWPWCTVWDGRIPEEAVSRSLFGLVVPVVIVFHTSTYFGWRKI